MVATLLATSVAMGAGPAWAKRKPAAAPAPAATQQTDDGPGAEKPAAQAADTEKPTPKADPETSDQDAVKPDAQGNVNFGSQKNGKGRITVKAAPGENVKVFLEGRLFGKAPQTINRVPPGDYIVEAVYPSGKTVSKAVSVSRDEEQVVELDSVAVAEANGTAPRMGSEEASTRIHKAVVYGGIATVGFLAVGVGLGLWERSVQSDYNKNPGTTSEQQNAKDDLKKKGNLLAWGANGCFVAAGVSAIVAAIYAYPALRAEKKQTNGGEEAPPNLSFMVLPTKDSVQAGFGLTF